MEISVVFRAIKAKQSDNHFPKHAYIHMCMVSIYMYHQIITTELHLQLRYLYV